MIPFDPSKVIAKQCAEIKPSGIRKFFDMLDGMKDVISLTVGQPDFVTPWKIREAGIESIEQGKTYYTSNSGLPALREEISAYLERSFSLSYDAERELLVTIGGSEAVDLAARALLDPGDEVILHYPNYVCYEPLCRMCGAKVVPIVTTERENFKVTPEALRAVITLKTKLLVLSYPNNPTGGIMERADLEAIADVIRDTGIVVLSDEIYAELTYGSRHVSFGSLPGMKERTVVCSGFSKAFAMTGWRLGYVAAPAPILSAIRKIHQYAIMCAPTASQFAGLTAMREGQEAMREMIAEYDRRRKLTLSELAKIGLSCYEPKGAFYVFPDISRFGLTSQEFASRLITEARAAVVPGDAFGESGEGYIRISYAYSVNHIKEGIARMGRFLSTL